MTFEEIAATFFGPCQCEFAMNYLGREEKCSRCLLLLALKQVRAQAFEEAAEVAKAIQSQWMSDRDEARSKRTKGTFMRMAVAAAEIARAIEAKAKEGGK